MYYASLIIAASSGMLYHITQKSIDSKVNPLISLLVSYIVALVLTLIMYFFRRDSIILVDELKHINWASYSLGFAIVGMEIAILMAYRTGWNVGNFSIINNILIAAVLLPIGFFLFKENISIKTVLGLFVSLAGIVIMKI